MQKKKRRNKDAKRLAKKLTKKYEAYLNEKLDSHLQLQGFVFSLKSKLSDRYVTKLLPKSNKLLFENQKLDPTFKQDRYKFYSVNSVTVFYGHTFSFDSEKSFNETSYGWV